MKRTPSSIACDVAALCLLVLMVGAIATLASAELEMEKVVTTLSGSCLTAGDTLSIDARTSVLFCYTIRNTGSHTATQLQLIEDNGTPDDLTDDFSVPLGLSELPAQFTLNVQVIYDADTPGTFRHVATISGDNDGPNGGSVRAIDYVYLRVAPVNAQLEITKAVTTPGGSCQGASNTIAVDAQSAVLFCYTIKNNGEAPASNLELVEDNGTPSDLSDDYVVSLGSNTSIDPGFQLQVQHLYQVGAPGTVTHSATVSGINQGTSYGSTAASDDVAVTAMPVDAVIELTKTVTTSVGSCLSAGPSLTAEAGSELQFCYTIHNAGKATVRDLSLSEDNGTPNDPSDDFLVPLGGAGDVLLPQTTVTITGTKMTPIPPNLGPVDYTATVHGTNDGSTGGTISAEDAATVSWSDTNPPVITDCAAPVRISNTWGIMGAQVNLPLPTATDSSGMALEVHFDPASGTVFPVGTTQVQATVTDAGGNADTCTFDVEVNYGTPPRIKIELPQDGDRVALHASITPQFHVESVATLDQVATSLLVGGVLDSSSPGIHEFSVTATDEQALSSTASVRYHVAYVVGPSGPMEEWPGEWLFLEKPLLINARTDAGAVPLGGRFIIGEEIGILFTLRDALGIPQVSGIGQLTVTKASDADEDVPDEVIVFYTIGYDGDQAAYAQTIPTAGWSPGLYDLWLGLDDDTMRRVRVEIVEP